MRASLRIWSLFSTLAFFACQPEGQVSNQGSQTKAINEDTEKYITGHSPECAIKGRHLEKLIKALYGTHSENAEPTSEEKAVLSGETSGAEECSEEVVDYFIEFLTSHSGERGSHVAVELPNIGSPAGSGLICGYAINSRGDRFDFKIPKNGATPAQIEAFKIQVTGSAMKNRGFVIFGGGCGV